MNKRDFDRFLQVTAQCTKTFTRFRLGTADTEPVEKNKRPLSKDMFLERRRERINEEPIRKQR